MWKWTINITYLFRIIKNTKYRREIINWQNTLLKNKRSEKEQNRTLINKIVIKNKNIFKGKTVD